MRKIKGSLSVETALYVGRMSTADRDNYTPSQIGAQIYNTTTERGEEWTGTEWQPTGGVDSALTTRVAAVETRALNNTGDIDSLQENAHPRHRVLEDIGGSTSMVEQTENKTSFIDSNGKTIASVSESAGGAGEVRVEGDGNTGGTLVLTEDVGEQSFTFRADSDMIEDLELIMPKTNARPYQVLEMGRENDNSKAFWAPGILNDGGNLFRGWSRIAENGPDGSKPYPLSRNPGNPGVLKNSPSALNNQYVELPASASNQQLSLLGHITDPYSAVPVNSLSQYEQYRIGGEFRVNEGTCRIYLGLDFYDAAGQRVNWEMAYHTAASVTTLTADLNPGDTTMEVADASGWVADSSYNSRFVAVCNYVDVGGYNWGTSGYTRNVYSINGISVSGNTITLNEPWPGPAVASGETVRQPRGASGTYTYLAWRGGAEDNRNWEWREELLTPPTSFGNTATQSAIRSGAASLRLLVLAYPVGGVAQVDVGRVELKEFPAT